MRFNGDKVPYGLTDSAGEIYSLGRMCPIIALSHFNHTRALLWVSLMGGVEGGHN